MTSDVFGRREVLGLVGVGLAAGLVAGCGGHGEPANAGAAAGAAGATPPADGPARGGAVSERANGAPGPAAAAVGAAAGAGVPRSGDLNFMTATELVGLLRSRAVSAREVMAAHLERISRVNPTLNAIVAKLDDECASRSRTRLTARRERRDVGRFTDCRSLQGSRRRRRASRARRLADLQGRDAGGGRPSRRAAARARA